MGFIINIVKYWSRINGIQPGLVPISVGKGSYFGKVKSVISNFNGAHSKLDWISWMSWWFELLMQHCMWYSIFIILNSSDWIIIEKDSQRRSIWVLLLHFGRTLLYRFSYVLNARTYRGISWFHGSVFDSNQISGECFAAIGAGSTRVSITLILIWILALKYRRLW